MSSQNVAIPVPNLIAGVSQQPPTLRVATAAELMENAWPSVVTGLNKRPPTEHLASLGIPQAQNAVGYLIDRDDSYQYIVVISGGNLKVFNLKGEQQTVAFPNGKAYLTQAVDESADFKFLTQGDTTFILNRQVMVQDNPFGESGTTSFSPTGSIYTTADLPAIANIGDVYHITSTDEYYRFTVVPAVDAKQAWTVNTGLVDTPYTADPVVKVLPEYAALGFQVWLTYNLGSKVQYALYQVTTAAGPVPEHNDWVKVRLSDLTTIDNKRLNPAGRFSVFVKESVANANYAIYINNVRVAQYTTKNGVDANNAVEMTDTIANFLAARCNLNGVPAINIGSTVCISGYYSGTQIVVTSSSGDRCMSCYADTVESFSDLAPNEPIGRIVKVKGDKKNQQDDYYVRFNEKSLWDEVVGFNQGGSLLGTTMPHTLRLLPDGTWTFGVHTWDQRITGDTVSNPGPSFVGQRLSDLFIYGARLGVISETNYVLSQTDEFENFYRTTMQTLLDSDPIDMEVLSPNVDGLRHVVPYQHDMLLFSDRSQFRLSYQNFIGPKNLSVQFTTTFPCSPSVKPANMGSSVYFVDDRTTYAYGKVFEYFLKDNLAGDDAENVTDPVPQYIPSGVRFLAASPRVKAMVVGTTGAPSSLFLYKFYWNGERKVQNAWSRWNFPDATRVFWAGFSMNMIYMLVKRGDDLLLERIRVDEEIYDKTSGTRILLDRLVSNSKLSVSYDAFRNVSFVTLPYQTNKDIQVVTSGDAGTNIWRVCTPISKNTVQINGDITGQIIWAGTSYRLKHTFSQPYIRQQRANGGELVALDGRLQMRYMTLEYHDTSYFYTVLETPGRNPSLTHYEAKAPNVPGVSYNATPVASGFHRIPLMSMNTNIKLSVINDSPFASAFGGAEWYGLYTPKAKRIG